MITALEESAQALFAICAAIAAMETLFSKKAGRETAFHSACALAIVLCVARAILRLMRS